MLGGFGVKQLENLITGREEKKRGFFLPNHCVYLGCACCHIPSMSRSYSRSPFSMSFLLRYLLFFPPFVTLCVRGEGTPRYRGKRNAGRLWLLSRQMRESPFIGGSCEKDDNSRAKTPPTYLTPFLPPFSQPVLLIAAPPISLSYGLDSAPSPFSLHSTSHLFIPSAAIDGCPHSTLPFNRNQ